MGADWTKLLADPDLVSHLGELLRTYRDASPESRDEALLAAMRKIKKEALGTGVSKDPESVHEPEPVATHAAAPPFEPDIFTPSPGWGQDRRRYSRLKCFVAVELRVAGSTKPIWGNLANTSPGGCLVETATPVGSSETVEIGLWLANGKVWIKGITLNGVVTRSSPSFGVRVKFADLEPLERETLRHFLRFVESTTKEYRSEQAYLSQLKR